MEAICCLNLSGGITLTQGENAELDVALLQSAVSSCTSKYMPHARKVHIKTAWYIDPQIWTVCIQAMIARHDKWQVRLATRLHAADSDASSSTLADDFMSVVSLDGRICGWAHACDMIEGMGLLVRRHTGRIGSNVWTVLPRGLCMLERLDCAGTRPIPKPRAAGTPQLAPPQHAGSGR